MEHEVSSSTPPKGHYVEVVRDAARAELWKSNSSVVAAHFCLCSRDRTTLVAWFADAEAIKDGVNDTGRDNRRRNRACTSRWINLRTGNSRSPSTVLSRESVSISAWGTTHNVIEEGGRKRRNEASRRNLILAGPRECRASGSQRLNPTPSPSYPSLSIYCNNKQLGSLLCPSLILLSNDKIQKDNLSFHVYYVTSGLLSL